MFLLKHYFSVVTRFTQSEVSKDETILTMDHDISPSYDMTCSEDCF